MVYNIYDILIFQFNCLIKQKCILNLTYFIINIESSCVLFFTAVMYMLNNNFILNNNIIHLKIVLYLI